MKTLAADPHHEPLDKKKCRPLSVFYVSWYGKRADAHVANVRVEGSIPFARSMRFSDWCDDWASAYAALAADVSVAIRCNSSSVSERTAWPT